MPEVGAATTWQRIILTAYLIFPGWECLIPKVGIIRSQAGNNSLVTMWRIGRK